MEETLIDYETAKLAKEKGFDWNTDYYYNTDGESRYASYYDPTPNNRGDMSWFSGGNTFCCAAPTQSLLQKWLRDVHSI